MTQNEIKALVSEAFKGSVKDELVNAIVIALRDEIKEELKDVKDAPRKGRGYHKKVDYTPTEGEVNICEYSESTVAVWGDLKDKADLLAIIKSAGTAKSERGREMRANFMRSLASIGTDDAHPCGWLLMKEALTANGIADQLILGTKLTEAGANVIMRESVAEVTAKRKDERRAERKAERKAKAPEAPAPKAEAPKKASAKVIKGCKCYEPSKCEAQYEVKERDLVSRGKYYIYQAAKGAAIYINAGVDAETHEDVYALITKVKGDISKSIHPDASTWNEVADLGIVEAVKADKLKATVALMNAVARYGEDEDIDVLWNCIA